MRHIYIRIIYIGLLFTYGLFWGCNTINPKEQVPTYIHVDSFQFIGAPGILAAKSHSIQVVWAYYNNNLIGVFDLPVTFPVMTNGDSATGVLMLSPGILVNGLNNSPSKYSFYTSDTFTFRAQPGQVINHTPKTMFYSQVTVKEVARFDGGTTGFGLAAGNIPMTLVGDSLAFDGPYSGSILLTAPADSSVDSTIQSFTIPFGVSAFLEFDYKSDLPFYVGMRSNLSGITSPVNYLTGISPSTGWRKFYLFLGDFITSFQGDTYQFYIKTSIPSGSSGGRLLVDNFQIVTF